MCMQDLRAKLHALKKFLIFLYSDVYVEHYSKLTNQNLKRFFGLILFYKLEIEKTCNKSSWTWIFPNEFSSLGKYFAITIKIIT